MSDKYVNDDLIKDILYDIETPSREDNILMDDDSDMFLDDDTEMFLDDDGLVKKCNSLTIYNMVYLTFIVIFGMLCIILLFTNDKTLHYFALFFQMMSTVSGFANYLAELGYNKSSMGVFGVGAVIAGFSTMYKKKVVYFITNPNLPP